MHGSARCLPPLAAVALFTLVFGPGCTRHAFRERADKDVEGVITQKNVFPDWQVKNWHVYPDPRARFADNSRPDRPPYPPDDYAARLMAPNPQKPRKKAGVGRVDGEGYIALLQQWDSQNRAEDPPPPARGAPPRATPAAAQVAPDNALPLAPAKPLPAPTVAQGERPAVRHALPSSTPAALQPGAATQPDQPAPVVASAGPEFGPWVGARPSMPGPVVTTGTNGPSITELRAPVVMVVVGEVEQNGNLVPAVGVVPIGAVGQPVAQPPEKGSDPKPLPGPMPLDPKQPEPMPGGPVGKGPAGPLPVVTGEPAADYLRALESGQVGFRLKLEQAIELGLINGREFQDRREDLYLAALQVTLSRFSFAAQAFLTEEAVRQSTGPGLTRNFLRNSSTTLDTTVGFSKLFSTGALLTAQIANQVAVDLSGENPTTAVSNLALNLMQPFLRGGGKAVALEDLTQSERTMVYAMRSYARFRGVFFVALAAGGGYTNNPYGLQGLSPNLGRGIGGNLTAPNIGYLPLLLQQATINNQRKNVAELERLLRIYRAYGDGGVLAPLQVGQIEVQLLNSRGQLLGTAGGGGGIRGYLDALDNFKLQLGLPVTVPLELDDNPLRPIRSQLSRLEDVFAQARAVDADAERFDSATPVAQFRARWRALLTNSPLARGTAFAKTIGPRWDAWAALTADELDKRLLALQTERKKLLDAQTDRQAKGQPENADEVRRLEEVKSEFNLGAFERAVRVYEAQPWLKKGDTFVPQAAAYGAVAIAFKLLAIETQNERLASARSKWPELPPLPVGGADVLATSLDEAYTAGVQTALTARLDLMNARAQVVDAWRQIAVTANSLQGVFDVRYDLTGATPAGGNNPIAFSADRSKHQVTFNAELPLVRRAERNNYRAALVAYQRQRRTLMAFEDNIANDVRSDLRELRTLAQLYRIQQRVVELGYDQVDSAQLTAFAPLAAGVNLDPAAQAALTQQVLQTQANLVQGQNQMFQIWVAYQTARMNLYLDLEQLPLDERGVWCDEFFNRADRQDRTPDDRQPGERLHAPRPLDNGPPR